MQFSSWLLLWISLLLCFFLQLYGYPSQLPEPIEVTNENSSTCYGTLIQFQPSCLHRPGTVIGVQAVKVGAKPTSLDCPDNVPDDEPRNDTCCSPNEGTDCIQVFDYMKSFIPEKYKFHTLCSGFQECIKPAETVWAQSDCGNITVEYMKLTNYMFMEYSCIEEAKIGSLCSDDKYSKTGSAFYLQSPTYQRSDISDVTKCECNVKSSSNIKVYTVDLRLYGQKLSIVDSHTDVKYDETNATMFNITSTEMTGNILVTFDNSSAENDAYIWIGFEAMDNSSLTVSCKVYGLPDPSTIAPTIAPSTSTTVSPITSLNSSSRPSASKTKGFAVGIIIGIAFGLLCLFVVLMIPICYLCKRKKNNPEGKGKDSNLMQDDKGSDISGVTRKSLYTSRNPMNEKFKPSNIPSNKVEPTRYIEEHGSIRSVLPQIGRSSSWKAHAQRDDGAYSTTRYLPPLNTSPLDVVKSVNETAETEHKRKKKRKKRKSHKQRHVEENGANHARSDNEREKVTGHSQHRVSESSQRRHSSKKRHRSHSDSRPPDSNYFAN